MTTQIPDSCMIDGRRWVIESWNGDHVCVPPNESLGFRTVTGAAQAATEAGDRIIYNSSTGALYYDADGSSGPAQAILFAILSTHPASLSAADFSIL